MRKRRGYSLVECLVAIGLIGATFSTLTVALTGVCRCCQRVGEESATEIELERFAAALRADAHVALSASLEDAADPNQPARVLRLPLADEQSVKYTLRAGYIERVLQSNDELRHRETYRLPKSFATRWQVDRDRSRPMVSLMLDPGSAGPLGFQAMRIDAAVGLLGPAPTEQES